MIEPSPLSRLKTVLAEWIHEERQASKRLREDNERMRKELSKCDGVDLETDKPTNLELFEAIVAFVGSLVAVILAIIILVTLVYALLFTGGT